jgi:hypothetical protein
MSRSSSTQPNVRIGPPGTRPPATDFDELPEPIPGLESVILPDMFEVPESWRLFGARLRARLGHLAHPH